MDNQLGLQIFVALAAFSIYVAVNILLIIVILSKDELKQKPGNWLILTMSFYMLVESTIFLATTVQPDGDLAHFMTVPRLCDFVNILYHIIVLAVPTSVLLITTERFASIVKYKGSEPGMSKGASIGSLIGCSLAAIILPLVSIFLVGDGIMRVMFDEHRSICFVPSASKIMLYVCEGLIIITIIILTTCIAIWWCNNATEEVRGTALPVVVVNIFYLALEIPFFIKLVLVNTNVAVFNYYAYTTTAYVQAASGILVPILWLACSREFRKSYRQTCCPCCPEDEEVAEKIQLLDSK